MPVKVVSTAEDFSKTTFCKNITSFTSLLVNDYRPHGDPSHGTGEGWGITNTWATYFLYIWPDGPQPSSISALDTCVSFFFFGLHRPRWIFFPAAILTWNRGQRQQLLIALMRAHVMTAVVTPVFDYFILSNGCCGTSLLWCYCFDNNTVHSFPSNITTWWFSFLRLFLSSHILGRAWEKQVMGKKQRWW